jgi:hypothetical protein
VILANLAGLLMLIGAGLATILLVPWTRIRQLLPVGLVAGLVTALILVYLMQNVFQFWTFYQVDFLVVGGIPFFLSATWVPLVICYSHLLAQYRRAWSTALLILSFPAGATAVHYLLILNKMLQYQRWNLGYTFLLGLLIHLGIFAYLYRSGCLETLSHSPVSSGP